MSELIIACHQKSEPGSCAVLSVSYRQINCHWNH